jgi:hypothetical protein
VAAAAALASGTDRAVPDRAPITGRHGAPQGTAGKKGGSVTGRKNAAQKPKAAVKSKAARTTSRPLLIFVPSSGAATVESGIGGAENCASYTGCTDEEYCIIWFVRCELVAPPVGWLDPRRLTTS